MRDELTPLMIFLTTDFDYRCAKLGTIFTEKRDLTDDEITKVSFFMPEFVGHGHKRGLFINTDMTRLRRFGFRTFFRSFYLTKL